MNLLRSSEMVYTHMYMYIHTNNKYSSEVFPHDIIKIQPVSLSHLKIIVTVVVVLGVS